MTMLGFKNQEDFEHFERIKDEGAETPTEAFYRECRETFHWYVIPVIIISLLALLFIVMRPAEVKADEIAIQTIAYEARGETFEGQVAVASVIKKRMEEKNKTAEQVVLQPHQFSCWHPKTHKPTQKAKLSAKALETARKAWETATADIYNHYARYDCKPSWIKSSKQSKRINNHIFYQL
jgi:hypothetical protein